MNSKEIFEREFLGIRAKLLEVAASLDRIDRADGSVKDDPRLKLIEDAIGVISSDQNDPIRAEKIQLLFSREYDANWQKSFEIATRT